MSKYKVRLQFSKLKLFLQLCTFLLLVFSILNWQENIFPFQQGIQIALIGAVGFYVIRDILIGHPNEVADLVFSQHGFWLESDHGEQQEWRITKQSRVTSLLLFIHLVSPINSQQAKWRLVFIDQLSKRDYRRMCRAINFLQQSSRAH